jgi:hypothetical protein
MASLSAYYPLPVVAGTTAGTYAEGDDSRIVGALPAATAGSGSVLASGSDTSRTLSNRFGEVFHVDDYGAKGDWNGSTGTDDTAAIQAAIDAAIAAGGGTVEFRSGKTYLLDSGHAFPIAGSLKIEGGTNSTKLRFQGNGARLWIQRNNQQILWIFFKAHTRCHSIEFSDLTFERSDVRLPSNYTSQENNAAFVMAPKSTDAIDHVSFYNCSFVNTFSVSIKQYNWPNHENGAGAVSWDLVYNKIRLFEAVNCKFIYPYGSNSLNPLGGGQMINLSQWVETAIYSGCYIDGAVGGKIPNDVLWPKDGFSYVNASNSIIENCHLRNYWVEGIMAWSDGAPNLASIKNFTQPAINSNVTLTLTSGNVNFNELIVGEKYVIMPADQYLNMEAPCGVYEVVSVPVDWNENTTFEVKRVANEFMPFGDQSWNFSPRAENSRITITWVVFDFTGTDTHSVRGNYYYDGDVNGKASYIYQPISTNFDPVSGTKIQWSSANNRWEVVTGGSTVRFYNTSTAATVPSSGWTDGGSVSATAVLNTKTRHTFFRLSHTKNVSFIVKGCTFDSDVIFSEDGITRGPFAPTPCIKAHCPIVVEGCIFTGKYSYAISCAPQFHPAPTGPFLITNNIFNGSKPTISETQHREPHIYCLGDYSIISGNIIKQPESKDFEYGCVVSGKGVKIINNTFVVENPSAQINLTQAIQCYNSKGLVSWDMLIENNRVEGFDRFINSLPSVKVGPVTGTPRVAMFNGSITTGTTVPSNDGSLWNMRITNDGEIEVTK